VEIIAHNCDNIFDKLKTEWNQLLNQSTANCIFSTWEWQSTWWKTYSTGNLWLVTCRNDEGTLIAIAPWFIEHAEDGKRIVRSVGCVDVTDYVDIIVHRDWVEPVLEGLADFLLDNQAAFDMIDLCNLPSNSVTHKKLPATLTTRGFEVRVEQQEVCPIITLPETWDDYLAALPKKSRHELRRKIRRAQNAPEKIDWYIVENQDDLENEMEQFLLLMRASHPEKAAFLDEVENKHFFEAIAPLMFENGWLQLAFLTIDDKPAATYLNFDYNNQVLVYNSGILPDEYGHLSPGIVLLAHLIEHAINQKRTVLDFLRGDETYKYRMGGQDTPIYMLEAKLSRH